MFLEKSEIVANIIVDPDNEKLLIEVENSENHELLNDFNESITKLSETKAYLKTWNNYQQDKENKELYQKFLEAKDKYWDTKLAYSKQFIEKYIKYGDTKDILYRIDNGRIKPSKSLADSVASMLKGNEEFNMIDDQKVVYEELFDLVINNEFNEKRTIIIEGGPGTGKSVIAINLLSKLSSG